MTQASEAKLALRNQERKALEQATIALQEAIEVRKTYNSLIDDLRRFAYTLCVENQHNLEEYLNQIINDHLV